MHLKQRYLLPEGRSWNRWPAGWVLSDMMDLALRLMRRLYMLSKGGSPQPTILDAVLTTRFSFLLSLAEAAPYHAVIEKVRTLSMMER